MRLAAIKQVETIAGIDRTVFACDAKKDDDGV
jgi:hypothetical protein